MKAPMTRDFIAAYDLMVKGGMKERDAYERLADFAAMLEDRLSELDEAYQSHPWGRNKTSLFAADRSEK